LWHGGTDDRANPVNVAVVTSVSANIAGMATLTIPNKAEYCLRHGYSLVVDNRPYEEAVAGVAWMTALFERFDVVWCLDADAVITDMTTRIDTLDCLGPHVTVCEEGIVEWNLINCGSIVIRSTRESADLLIRISGNVDEWAGLQCGWQTWLANKRSKLGDTLTVAPLRSFNSCVWNRPANARDEIGGHWRHGDLVYHPCGVYPHDERLRWVRFALGEVRR
ncbi:hypothetical protein EBZ38_14640, partial [bacterium]|nr:hypothetical protein [bacterium]